MASWCDTGQNQRRPRGTRSRARTLRKSPCPRLDPALSWLDRIFSMPCSTPSRIPMRRRRFSTRLPSGRWFTMAIPTTSSSIIRILIPLLRCRRRCRRINNLSRYGNLPLQRILGPLNRSTSQRTTINQCVRPHNTAVHLVKRLQTRLILHRLARNNVRRRRSQLNHSLQSLVQIPLFRC